MLLGLGKTITFGQKKIYPYATGGDYVYLYEEGGKTYRVHEFHTTGTSTLNVEDGGQVEYLVVGGGGGGGRGKGGGGGGGGALYGSTNVSEENITISVGAGGTGAIYSPASGATNGMDSSFNGIVAYGGGFGGGWVVGRDGGTGGAGGGGLGVRNDTPGTGAPGITGQGYAGGDGVSTSSTTSCAGGGGGGAGETGQDASINVGGNGGSGIEWPSGSGRYYGGGGGGYVESGTPGSGGTGGGGAGATTTNDGANGLTNTGGGGGGGGASYLSDGGDGGSGIVIVRYVIAEKTLWTPSESTSLVAWWKADSLTNLSDSNSVSSWNDESGNGYNVSQGQSGTDPIYKENIINNLPVIRFTDGGKNLERTDSGITIARNASGLITSSVVNLRTAATQRKDVVGVVSGVNTINYLAAIDFHRTANKHCSLIRRGGNDSPTIAVSSANYSAGSWYIRSTIHDWSTGNLYQYVDGSLDPTSPATHGGSSNTEDTDNSVIKIGGFLSSSVGAFDIGEIVILKDTVDTVDLQKIEGYLAHKWGLTDNLPSGHPYKYEPPYKEEPEEIVTDGLVLNLDAGDYASYPRSGTTWYDISGNGLNGTLTNGPTYDSANKGSIVFDGSDDYVDVSSTTPTSLQGNPSFTVEGWFKKSGSWSGGSSWGLGGGTTLQGINSFNGIGVNTDEISIDLWGTSTYTTNIQYSSTEWKHIAWTYNGQGFTTSNIIIYINGVAYTGNDLEVLRGGSGTPNINNNGIVLGRAGRTIDNYYGKPIIGNFRIYSKVLSSTEIQQNYDALKGRYGL